MNELIKRIDELTAELAALKPLKDEYQRRLDKKIRLEFNYNSNHIEGNTLTYGETELLLIFDKTTGNHELREYEEMKAHDVAFEMIKEWAIDTERPLSQSGVRGLHETLLVRPFWKEALTPDGQSTRRLIEVGSYKTQPNSVRLQNGEMFHYASPEETPIKMQELMDWYLEREAQRDLHPVELAALFHYRFVRIHPFDDGNGRISRLLMNYVLLKYELPPVIIKSADKRNYLFALNQADTGNLQAFVDYIATQLVWMLEIAIKAGKGEVLDEADDIDKEIEIWKREAMAQKIGAPHRSNEQIYNLYIKGNIQYLFECFIDYHKNFVDLFRSTDIIINDNHSKRVANPSGLLETMDQNLGDDTYTHLQAGVYFYEYKYSEKSPFDIGSILTVDLEPYAYILKYNGKPIVQKEYGEYLVYETLKRIAGDCARTLLADIKGNAKQGNDEIPNMLFDK